MTCSQAKRIGIFCYPLTSGGGVYRWITETSKELVAYGTEVHLLLGGPIAERLDFPHVRSVTVASAEGPIWRESELGLTQWALTNSLQLVISVLPNANLLLARSALSLPKVVTLHGDLPKGYKGTAYRVLFRWYRRRVKLVVVVSERLQLLASCLWPRRPVTTLPNIVAPEGFESESDQRTGALWVGRLEPEKGLQRLGEIAHQSTSSITVVGDGTQRHVVEVLALRSNLEYLGWVNNTRPLLQSSAVFLTTSPSEGLSFAFLDALAHGCVPLCYAPAYSWLPLPTECTYTSSSEAALKLSILEGLGGDRRRRLVAACRAALEAKHPATQFQTALKEVVDLAG